MGRYYESKFSLFDNNAKIIHNQIYVLDVNNSCFISLNTSRAQSLVDRFDSEISVGWS